eukprot:jgi/Hompol1/1530/HPOL_001856-RA
MRRSSTAQSEKHPCEFCQGVFTIATLRGPNHSSGNCLFEKFDRSKGIVDPTRVIELFCNTTDPEWIPHVARAHKLIADHPHKYHPADIQVDAGISVETLSNENLSIQANYHT